MDHNILFLCTGNSARSQMAEALLRHHANGAFKALSAGTEPREDVFPSVVEVMREIGIDLSDHRPKGIDEFLGRVHLYKVIIVCADAEQKCPVIFGPAERLFWPFDDPAAAPGSAEEVLAASRTIRDQIDERICEWLNEQGVEAVPFAGRKAQPS